MASTKMVNRQALVDGLIFLVLGALCVGEAYRLNITQSPILLHQELAPGLYVLLLGLVLLATGAAHLAIHLRSPADQAVVVSRQAGLRIVGIVLSLIAYGILINLVGYPAASFVFFVLILWIFAVRSIVLNLTISAILTAGCYVLFVHYFNVIFPRGVIFN